MKIQVKSAQKISGPAAYLPSSWIQVVLFPWKSCLELHYREGDFFSDSLRDSLSLYLLFLVLILSAFLQDFFKQSITIVVVVSIRVSEDRLSRFPV